MSAEPLALMIYLGEYPSGEASEAGVSARLSRGNSQRHGIVGKGGEVESDRQPAGTKAKRYAGHMRVALLALGCVLLGPGVRAEPASTTPGPSEIAIELNKLETQGSQCRAYFVITNKNGANYEELKLDLVVFKPDGVIGRRLTLELAPLKSNKRTVKLFELADAACDDVGSLLINEVMGCKTDSGPVDDCLTNISVSSLTKAQLTK